MRVEFTRTRKPPIGARDLPTIGDLCFFPYTDAKGFTKTLRLPMKKPGEIQIFFDLTPGQRRTVEKFFKEQREHIC